MSIAMSNSAPAPSDYFTSGQQFLETFMLLPQTTRNTNSRWLQSLFPPTANMTFATYCEHTSLTCPTIHTAISILSLLHFISTSFLSHEACSTNANSIFHAFIKNYHKNISTSYFSLLFLYFSQLSEEITQRKYTHACYNFFSLTITNILFAKSLREKTLNLNLLNSD